MKQVIDDEFKKKISEIIKNGFDKILEERVYVPPLQEGHRYLCREDEYIYAITVIQVSLTSYLIKGDEWHSEKWYSKREVEDKVIEKITDNKKNKFWFI